VLFVEFISRVHTSRVRPDRLRINYKTNLQPKIGGTMQLTDKHREYWSKNLRLTSILLAIWFVATYVATWFARELNEIVILGFPLGFYMGAQGALIIYVLVI